MTDRESFISAILERPSDDVCRLAFADWLDEFGDCDRDRATAEFIRLSCKMVASPRLSLPEGKWLDKGMNYAALLPTLFAWIDTFNEKHREAREWFGAERRPSVTWGRKGRNLEIKWRQSPLYIPEICTIELWRGFVRKVVNRHYETSDEFIKLILPDQPLCEPTLRFIDNDVPNRSSCGIHSGSIGPKGQSIISGFPAKTKPDRVTRRVGYDMLVWEDDANIPHRWSPQKRRYYAVAWLLRRTAMMEAPSVPVTQTEGAT